MVVHFDNGTVSHILLSAFLYCSLLIYGSAAPGRYRTPASTESQVGALMLSGRGQSPQLVLWSPLERDYQETAGWLLTNTAAGVSTDFLLSKPAYFKIAIIKTQQISSS